ncbi:outer membrane beta-barrel protein [Wenyingzhuangia sp. IMCC45467]
MNLKHFILWLFVSSSLFAQEENEEAYMYVDDHYLEDQLYLGIQYNFLTATNNGLKNTGVPFSLEAGFIKDIPLNKKRNKGLGIGIGYSFDVLRPNVAITKNGNDLVFNIDNNYSRYDYTSHNIEFPIEYRWRTSTATNDSFWRIYSGASFIYNINNSASFDDNNSTTTTFNNITALNNTNFSLYTSIGFGTWNFHIKYYINPIFKEGTKTQSGDSLNFNQLKIGMMFYIL